MNLRVRVVRCSAPGHECWYADIDDADDRQPDDPYWYVDGCGSQGDALDAACAQLAVIGRVLDAGGRLCRISGVGYESAA